MTIWQLEAAELRDRLIYEVGGKLPAEKKEQAVANYVQKANIKKNAALAIKVMYKKILDILKKVCMLSVIWKKCRSLQYNPIIINLANGF